MINKKMLIAIGLIMLSVGLWFFFHAKQTDKTETQKIISPRYGDIQTVITTTATVYPKNRLEIKPTVNGRVEHVLVAEGDYVKMGQVLAWMSSTDRAALLDAARGQGQAEYKKWVDVYKPIPLLAPIEGQVIVATTQPGQTVTTADSVVVLSDHLIVRAQVDETDIGHIKLHEPVIIALDAYPDDKINATVDHIYYESTTVNNVTIYNVDLLPKEIPIFFRSGMNANVDFITERHAHVLLLPLKAVEKSGDDDIVWLQTDQNQKPVKQVVVTGLSDARHVEIISGLKEDDQVVLKIKKFALSKGGTGKNPFMPSRPGNTKPKAGF